MVNHRVTLSLTPAVDSAIAILAMKEGISKSRFVDNLLRKNAQVKTVIAGFGQEPDTTGFAVGRGSIAKKGR
ncbi:MAG TPA: hypothetical protein VM582_03745 [Candidatus Thermoplasmatota archaeon]|nr:hypothetical protein [Candidatus Thermoplasmatota archaeon]